MRASLHKAFRGKRKREGLFKATLEDRATLGRIRDTAKDDQEIKDANQQGFTIKELRAQMYAGTEGAYQRAWTPEHQQKLRDGVYRHEPVYYNSVVKERQDAGKPTPTMKLEGSMTKAAVDAVIKSVDDLIGKDGFRPRL